MKRRITMKAYEWVWESVKKYGIIYALLMLIFLHQNYHKKKLTKRRVHLLDFLEEKLNKYDHHLETQTFLSEPENAQDKDIEIIQDENSEMYEDTIHELIEGSNCTINQAESLPSGWFWKEWNDGSGHLENANHESFFSYDQGPYYAAGGVKFCEQSYQKYSNWDVFWGSFRDFKAWAESQIKKQIELQKGVE